MKKPLFAAVYVLSAMPLFAAATVELPLPDEVALPKAEAILKKLDLDQKVKLLGGWGTMYLVDFPEAGIPRKWAFSDATHGIKAEHERWDWPHVKNYDNRCTVLPCGTALAMTWNRELAAAHGHVQGEQMRDRGKDQMLGPGVNINRQPMCGRNWEYMGEDPYLAGQMAVPMIKAVQTHGVAATIKHFCVNNQEWNRYTVDTVVDERTLHEIYFPAFKAAIQEGGSLCLMTSYNKFNGQYVSENSYLQRGILRDRWGFVGQIVTDWGGQHSTVPAALNGGNVEMNKGKGIIYFTDWMHNKFPLADAVRKGLVPEANIDEMALRVLYVMAKTGFLDGLQDKGCRFTDQHHNTARSIGEESIALLKNRKGVLPLDKKSIKKLVVVGKQSSLKQCHLGASAGAEAEYEITPFEGLKEYLGKDVEVELLPLGAETLGKDKPAVIPNGCLETFKKDGEAASAIRAWERRGWKPGKEWQGQGDVVGYVENPVGVKGKAQRYTAKVRAPETGAFCFFVAEGAKAKSVSIFINGERVFMASGKERHSYSHDLVKDQVYDVQLDISTCEKDGAIDFGWYTPSQIAESGKDKMALIHNADAVIVFTGSQLGWGRAHESEEHDIPSVEEPAGHNEEIAKLLKENLKNLVIVHRSGTQFEIPWADDCDTLLQESFLGSESGRPLARVIFGDVNPSGKLVFTWPRKHADSAVAQKGTYNGKAVIYNERFYVGYRWYDHEKIEPLFPFGYGLSYTTFAYDGVKAEKIESKSEGEVEQWKVSVKVTNTGKVAGKESVQLYMQPVDPKVERCVKELKGFAKTKLLAPGESEVLTMNVKSHDLAFYDIFLHRWHTPAGSYDLVLGSSSADARGTARISVAKDIIFND